MINTTLVYIEQRRAYLMLHRNKKANDVNEGKWIGVGGKFEQDETPEECMKRETFEETGLVVKDYTYRGIVTFISDRYETEYMHLFTVESFEGALKACDEGELVWVDKRRLVSLPHWDGDLLFLSLILNREVPFFSMKLSYQGDHLIEALLDGRPCFVTKRLLLRPWREADAKDLYRQAKDSSIGPMAGWMPHKNVAESKRIIRDILSGEEQYAILRHEGMECIGSIGITKYRPGDHNYQKDCGEIGYWIGRDHQGEGLMTEAVQCLLKHAFEDLQYTKVWGGVYDGNERSERVLKKCGFRYDHSLAEVPRKQLGDSADEHFCFVTKKMAAQARNRDHRYEEKIL